MGSGLRTWADGEIVTASNINGYLQKQVLICCTSASRPASPEQGMAIYETDTDRIRVYDGSSWNVMFRQSYTSHTPSYTNITVGNGSTTNCKYGRVGNQIHYRGRFTLGSTSSIGGTIAVDLPVTAASGVHSGTVMYSISSALYMGGSWTPSTGTLQFKTVGSTGNQNANATNPGTFANNDYFEWNIVYEAA